jgi:hypothetical protein
MITLKTLFSTGKFYHAGDRSATWQNITDERNLPKVSRYLYVPIPVPAKVVGWHNLLMNLREV